MVGDILLKSINETSLLNGNESKVSVMVCKTQNGMDLKDEKYENIKWMLHVTQQSKRKIILKLTGLAIKRQYREFLQKSRKICHSNQEILPKVMKAWLSMMSDIWKKSSTCEKRI